MSLISVVCFSHLRCGVSRIANRPGYASDPLVRIDCGGEDYNRVLQLSQKLFSFVSVSRKELLKCITQVDLLQ